MKRAEIVEKHWYDYLLWCATMPETTGELFKWLTLKEPTEANFWRWVVEIKKAKM